MAVVPRLMAPRPSALTLARPLLQTRHAWIRFSSSEAAAAAENPEPRQAQPQHQQQQPSHLPQTRSPFVPGGGPHQSAQDFWSSGGGSSSNSNIGGGGGGGGGAATSQAIRRSNVPNWLARPAPIEGSPFRNSVAGNPWESPYPQFRKGPGGDSVSDREKFDMLGLTPRGNSLGLGEVLSGLDEGLDLKRAEPAPVRLKPVSGKTIHCAAGMDPTRAFSALNRLTSLEKTALTQRQQRFHERPGLKRKRLASQRWRGRFAVGFAATVKRVQALTKQGW